MLNSSCQTIAWPKPSACSCNRVPSNVDRSSAVQSLGSANQRGWPLRGGGQLHGCAQGVGIGIRARQATGFLLVHHEAIRGVAIPGVAGFHTPRHPASIWPCHSNSRTTLLRLIDPLAIYPRITVDLDSVPSRLKSPWVHLHGRNVIKVIFKICNDVLCKLVAPITHS